jgi:hypothetical protein
MRESADLVRHCGTLKPAKEGETFMTLSADQPIEILGSCINCTSSASLLATFFVIFMGLALASRLERHKAGQIASVADTTR